MECKHCGKEIPDGAKFCRYCGMSQDESPAAPKAAPRTRKKKASAFPVKKVAIAAACVAALLLIGKLLFGGGSGGGIGSIGAETIKAEDIVKVTLDQEKFSGSSHADIKLDFSEVSDNALSREKLLKFAEKKLKNTGMADSEIQSVVESGSDYYSDPAQYITFTAENNESIANGDVISIRFKPASAWDDFKMSDITWADLCKEMGIKMDETYEYTVSGLKEGELIDFTIPDIQSMLQIDGVSGEADIRFGDKMPETYQVSDDIYMNRSAFGTLGGQYSVIVNNKEVGVYEFICAGPDGRAFNVKNGDEITITAVPSNSLLQYLAEKNQAPKETNVKFTISGIPEYVESLDDISVEDAKQMEEVINYQFPSSKIKEVYKASLNPTERTEDMYPVYLVYIVENQWGETNGILISDIYRDADGKLGTFIRGDKVWIAGSGESASEDQIIASFPRHTLTKLYTSTGESAADQSDSEQQMSDTTDQATPADQAGQTDQAKPADEGAEDSAKAIGKVTVLVDNLRIRGSASTNGEEKGHVRKGESYDVISTENADGYTWYQIGEDQFIASKEGEWTTYKKN